jgi:hypothetical protein
VTRTIEGTDTVFSGRETAPRRCDSARESGQFGAAIQPEVKRGEVAGFSVKRRENVTQLSSDERAERVRQLLSVAQIRAGGGRQFSAVGGRAHAEKLVATGGRLS